MLTRKQYPAKRQSAETRLAIECFGSRGTQRVRIARAMTATMMTLQVAASIFAFANRSKHPNPWHAPEADSWSGLGVAESEHREESP